MFKTSIFFISSLVIEIVFSQCLRQQQYNIINRPIAEYMEGPRIIEAPRIIEPSRIMESPRIVEAPRLYEAPRIIDGPRIIEAPRMIETPRYIDSPRIIDAPRIFSPSATIITEPPCNSIVPIPNMPSSTTLITDCTPAVCKNLANTIQLMIVCNLLQNTRGGPETAMRMASPILSEIMTAPTLSCGCSNPIAPMASGITPNMFAPGLISSNPKMMAPNMIPNIISATPSSPACNVASTNNLINSLMSLLSGGM